MFGRGMQEANCNRRAAGCLTVGFGYTLLCVCGAVHGAEMVYVSAMPPVRVVEDYRGSNQNQTHENLAEHDTRQNFVEYYSTYIIYPATDTTHI